MPFYTENDTLEALSGGEQRLPTGQLCILRERGQLHARLVTVRRYLRGSAGGLCIYECVLNGVRDSADKIHAWEGYLTPVSAFKESIAATFLREVAYDNRVVGDASFLLDGATLQGVPRVQVFLRRSDSPDRANRLEVSIAGVGTYSFKLRNTWLDTVERAAIAMEASGNSHDAAVGRC